MASSIGAGRIRTALWVIFGLLFVVIVIDSGSCTIARMQVDSDAKTSARYAVEQIKGMPVNQVTAVLAYNAATEALPNDKESIVKNGPGTKEDFRVDADGTITMTVVRQAPTLLFKHVPQLEKYTRATVTFTQQPLGF